MPDLSLSASYLFEIFFLRLQAMPRMLHDARFSPRAAWDRSFELVGQHLSRWVSAWSGLACRGRFEPEESPLWRSFPVC